MYLLYNNKGETQFWCFTYVLSVNGSNENVLIFPKTILIIIR